MHCSPGPSAFNVNTKEKKISQIQKTKNKKPNKNYTYIAAFFMHFTKKCIGVSQSESAISLKMFSANYSDAERCPLT